MRSLTSIVLCACVVIAGAGVSSSAFSVTVGLSPASSPLHFMLDVEIQPPPSTSAAQKDAMSTSEVAKQLLATIRYVACAPHASMREACEPQCWLQGLACKFTL